MLKIYDSVRQEKVPFEPIAPGKVSLYVCGMTVYDYCHIGHGRSMVVFDMVARYLQTLGYEVNFVRNITDIDDKIIKRALENQEDYHHLTNRFITAMHEDQKALNLMPVSKEPKATATIAEMIAMISHLIEREFAYVGRNGDVFFAVKKFDHYGKLSHRNIEQMQVGARIAEDPNKRDPLDFVLWKKAKPNEPAWPSPWGEGRPGWHIECSAMVKANLGITIDIHGGGMDLKFPHHENEIAQSEALHGKPFANYWMHAGLLQINSEKMSKSLNNFLTIREVLQQYNGEILKFLYLSSHYRSPLDYSNDAMHNADQGLQRLYGALKEVDTGAPLTQSDYQRHFQAAMNDDFNTPLALSILFELANDINSEKNQSKKQALGATLQQLGHAIGLLYQAPRQFLQSGVDQKQVTEIEQLIAERNLARNNKDWQAADRIREQLEARNIILEDSATGTTWRRR